MDEFWDVISGIGSGIAEAGVVIAILVGIFYAGPFLYQKYKESKSTNQGVVKTGLVWLIVDVMLFSSPLWIEMTVFAFLDGLGYKVAQMCIGIAVGLLLFSPRYANRSAQAYENSRERWTVIFVQRPPNILRARKKGRRIIDFVGNMPVGQTFGGVLTGSTLVPEQDEFWEIVSVPGAEAPVGVEVHKLISVRLWVNYINLWYDVALVGVKNMFDIHEYEIEKSRLIKKKDATGRVVVEVIPPVPNETSDHVRIKPQRWVVPIPGGELKKSRIPLDLVSVFYVRSCNPMRQLRNQESWSQFINSGGIDIGLRALRTLTDTAIFDITPQATGGLEGQDPINQELRKINKRLQDVVGLVIDDSARPEEDDYSGGVQLVAIDPIFRTEAEEKAFSAEWVAEREGLAEKVRQTLEGQGEADREARVTRAVALMVKRYGEAGVVARETDALERVATNKATVIANFGRRGEKGPDVQVDENTRLLQAILIQLQKQARDDGGDTK